NLLLLSPIRGFQARLLTTPSGSAIRNWIQTRWSRLRERFFRRRTNEYLSIQDQLFFANTVLKDAFSVGFKLQKVESPPSFELRSDTIFIPPEFQRAVKAAGTSNEYDILTFLVNLFWSGTNTTPYSMITAAGPPYTPSDMKDDEIVLTQWLADDLNASKGETIELSYFLPESGAKLLEGTNRFRVHSIVTMELPWTDRTLMPDFP